MSENFPISVDEMRDAQEHLKNGITLHEKKEFKEAIEAFKKVAMIHPFDTKHIDELSAKLKEGSYKLQQESIAFMGCAAVHFNELVRGLDEEKKWEFTCTVKKGDVVFPGMILGEVKETKTILHKIICPPFDEFNGKINEVKSGKFTVNDVIGKLENGTEIKMSHEWPVRVPRKFSIKEITPIYMHNFVIILIFLQH